MINVWETAKPQDLAGLKYNFFLLSGSSNKFSQLTLKQMYVDK